MTSAFISKFLQQAEDLSQRRYLRTIEFMEGPYVEIEGIKFVNFSSNNTLGLAQHPHLKAKAIEFVEKYGTGATASRLVSGNHHYHLEVEQQFAKCLKRESTLFFSSGFQANLAAISAIADRETIIFADRACHQSLVQGSLISRAKVLRYLHQDLNHLENLLTKHASAKRRLIVTESLFSMDGDWTDLTAIVELAKRHHALLLVDDAHSLGVAGRNGFGLTEGHEGINIITGGFGKAAGASGGYLACDAQMRDFLLQRAAAFIYSTAIAPSIVGAIQGAIQIIPKLNKERELLAMASEKLREGLKKKGLSTGLSNSHIIPVILGQEEQALTFAERLAQHQMLVVPIRPPTVPTGTSRLRISLSSLHTSEQINTLLEAL